MDKSKEVDCEDCFKIVCKKCGWTADEKEVLQIQQGEFTACPLCGWQPSSRRR